MNLFKGVKNIMSSVAQIVLVVILLPFAAIIIKAISSDGDAAANMNGLLTRLIGQIPMCEMWTDVLESISTGISINEVLSSSVLVMLRAFPEALISAVFIHVCVEIHNKIGKGLPIFAAFIGVVLSTVILSLTGKSDSIVREILFDFGVIIVLIIGIKILGKSFFSGGKLFSGKTIFLMVIDGMFAVITSGYVSALLLTARGGFATKGALIGTIVALSVLEIVAALVVGVIHIASDKAFRSS